MDKDVCPNGHEINPEKLQCNLDLSRGDTLVMGAGVVISTPKKNSDGKLTYKAPLRICPECGIIFVAPKTISGLFKVAQMKM